MRFRLRTLLIVLAVGPPVLAGLYWGSLAVRVVSEGVEYFVLRESRYRDEHNAAAGIKRLKEYRESQKASPLP
jgi:hypothetical protein